MTTAPTVIGIDVGGTKIAGGVINPADPTRVLDSVRRPTPTAHVVEAILDVLTELRNRSHTPIAGVGIGAPGVIDTATGTVISAGPTMPGWAGTHIRRDIANATGLPVHVANDVRVLGLGEARFGAGRRYDNILFLSLGTGVGGAIVRNGSLQASPHHTAGELRGLIARRVADGAAPVEDVASGPGMTATYERLSGVKRDLREVVARYDTDEIARRVIDVSMLNLGECMAGFVSAIDVDAIVVGGGVGGIGDRILAPLRHGFRTFALEPVDSIDIIPAVLGADAPVIGAASLVNP